MRRHVSIRVALGLLLAVALVATAAAEQEYKDKLTRYTFGDLPASWEQIKPKGKDAKTIDLAYFNTEGGASILLNSTCEFNRPVPLEALTNHLLLDMTHREIESRQELIIDGRMGLRTILSGRLDGAAVKMDIRVVKIDSCAYDLIYVAPPEAFGDGHDDFKRLVTSFHVQRESDD